MAGVTAREVSIAVYMNAVRTKSKWTLLATGDTDVLRTCNIYVTSTAGDSYSIIDSHNFLLIRKKCEIISNFDKAWAVNATVNAAVIPDHYEHNS